MVQGDTISGFSISLSLGDNRYFLAHAYNWIALFAYAERTFFRTPYDKGDITIRKNYLGVSHRQPLCFEARMPEDGPVVQSGDDSDELVGYLPRRLRKNPDHPHYFYARLEGTSENFGMSNVMISQPDVTTEPILNMLQGSQFEIKQWWVRQAARQ